MNKKIVKYILLLIGIPLVIIMGTKVFQDKLYAFVSLAVVIIACIPFFMNFETNNRNIHKMVILSVMIALSVAGRFIFAPIPDFKPVTAIVVITAIYFGSEAGFLTGALSAIISNFYFGQGPWTPFQMFTWGLIGLLAGLLAKRLKSSIIILSIYGVFAGILFSFIMDVWTVLWFQNGFNLKMYLSAIALAAPHTIIYAISNVVFLVCLSKPIGQKLERIIVKYGL